MDGKPEPQPDEQLRIPEARFRVIDADFDVVDTQTGEIHHCPACVERDREIKKLKTEARSWQRKYQNAMDDRDAKARADDKWGKALALWNEWKIATGKVKSRWSADRFWLCEPFLKADGFVICRWAVWGIAYEPNTKRFSSGLVEVYNTWELCFRDRGTFERYAVRGYFNPEARAQFSLKERIGGEDDETINPQKYFRSKRAKPDAP